MAKNHNYCWHKLHHMTKATYLRNGVKTKSQSQPRFSLKTSEIELQRMAISFIQWWWRPPRKKHMKSSPNLNKEIFPNTTMPERRWWAIQLKSNDMIVCSTNRYRCLSHNQWSRLAIFSNNSFQKEKLVCQWIYTDFQWKGHTQNMQPKPSY